VSLAATVDVPLLFAAVPYSLVCHEEDLQDEFTTLVVVV
jgi:hypothetical protein